LKHSLLGREASVLLLATYTTNYLYIRHCVNNIKKNISRLTTDLAHKVQEVNSMLDKIDEL